MPARTREDNRAAVRRHRVRKGEAVAELAEAVQRAGELPDPPSRDVLLKALGVQAVQGNVAAIRLLLEEYRRDGDTDEKPVISAIDELAGRRAKRAG